jgi:putative membrane protein
VISTGDLEALIGALKATYRPEWAGAQFARTSPGGRRSEIGARTPRSDRHEGGERVEMGLSPGIRPSILPREWRTLLRVNQTVSAERDGPPVAVRLGISWLTNALVLGVVVALLSKVTVSDAGALLAAAAVFGVLNTLLKPLLRFVTLPLAVLTFGIAWFFVSLLMLVLTKAIVSGFHISGFWTLVEATLIVWVVNLALDFTPGPWQITGKRRRMNRRRRRLST